MRRIVRATNCPVTLLLMFHTKIKLKYFLNTFHFKIQILKILMDHIRGSFQSAVGPVSTRPFHSSPLSIIDRVRRLRPKQIWNEEIIEKNTKMKKVQFECIQSHYLYILAQCAKQFGE